MLIGIPACLGPQLLCNLRAMGHGDEIALVDGNYPAQSHAAGAGGLVRADGLTLLPLLEAILAVMPLDRFVEHAVLHSTVNGDGHTLAPVHREMRSLVERRLPRSAVAALPGEAFYARVGHAHTIVATSEPRLYSNVILRKGVIEPAIGI
jgi:L-fucose mutarotase